MKENAVCRQRSCYPKKVTKAWLVKEGKNREPPKNSYNQPKLVTVCVSQDDLQLTGL